MKTVAQYHAEFNKVVVAAKAGPDQCNDMRVAFYSGFYAALTAGTAMAREAGSDDEAIAMIKRLHDECWQFMLGILND